MKTRNLFLLVTLLAIAQGTWAQGIPYVDRSWDEATQRVVEKIDTCKDYRTFGGYDEWFGLYDNQWYVVRGHVRQTALNVLGDAHIILCDNAVLDVKHIKLESGKKLHIYGQQRGNGRLVARNTEANSGYTDAAGIGGGNGASMGTLCINGGNVIAHGNKYAAGIGGGKNGHGGWLVVYGGYVEGHAGADAAGIGGGETGNGQSVRIYGGTVWGWGYAEGGADRNNSYGAGIGGGQDGDSGDILIYGGKVYGYGGMDAAGIGTGEETTGHSIRTNALEFHGGTVYAEGRGCASGIGSGEDAFCGYILISGGTIHAKGGSHEKAMAMGSYDNHDETTISFGNHLEAWSTDRSAMYYERPAFCRERKEVWIEPCNHDGTWGPKGNYTDNGDGTHTLTCNYCAGGTSPHTLEPEGFCTLCSYDPTGSLEHTVTTENGLRKMVKNGAVITLGADIALSNYLGIAGGTTVTLDLNGHTLSRSLSAADADGHVIWIREGGTLTVKDSSGNNSGKLTGGWAFNGGGINVSKNSTLYFQGGTITGCKGSATGGGICNKGTCYFEGGVIDNCWSLDCGGIFNFDAGCTLTISGGTIQNCTSDRGGGAVVNDGTLTISGGIFTGNRCQTGGGGVWNNPGATLTITGGTIMDNSADLHGGGIYSNGSFKMSGAPFITGNTVNGGSENLYLEKGAVITVIGRLEDCSVGVTAADMSAAITKDYSKYNTADGFIFGDGGITTELRNGELYLKQGAMAITEGTGTDSDPYLLEHSGHWQWLAQQVSGGNTFEGKTLRMTADIDASGTQIAGTFKGTFDGGGHTLRYNVGSDANFANTDGLAPFQTLEGATIRHLRIGGTIYTKRRFAAGLAVTTQGTDTTTVLDVRSSISIWGSVIGDATHAGLITQCYAPTNFEQCSFLGSIIAGSSKRCAGMVGWTDKKVSFKYCFVDPTNVQIGNDISDYALGLASGTFIRMKMNEGSATFENCYYTNPIGTKQGTAVFNEVRMPQGCSATIEGEPVFKYDGKNYYTTGTIITTITPDNYLWFHHWVPANGVFISDPFAENGRHRVEDLNGAVITLDYTPYEVEAETEREYFGTVYRWLSRRDYHLYISEEYRQSKGWYWENDDEDANLIMKDGSDEAEITVVTGFKENNYEDGGLTYVMNDCVGSFHNHTHLAAIAPRAYAYSFGLKRLRFMDSDADIYNQNTQLRFYIDEQAFLGCENLEQLQIVQYTTRGSNHYEPIRPDQIVGVALNAFEGCSPRMSISTYRDQYQNFMNSAMWSPFRERLVVHEFDEADFTEYGVKYHVYKDSEERDRVKNDESGLAQMRNVVKWWNSEYQNFNAVNLLKTNPDCNVYYTSIVGVDDEDIDDEGGVMRIYNDIGSYYNYKTIQLGRDAIRGNEHVKYIEFWQTNGRSENSYSDLKMVIPNGALAGMKNLKELRLFYYEQDGDDHWTALGPKDIIPGNNIFGNLSVEEMESMPDQAWASIKAGVPEDFKIIVSSDRMAEFIDDSNWQPYIGLMECRDEPNNQNLPEFRDGNVVYDYVTAPGGIIQTTQVASQDVSWWTLPRIVAEVALWSYAIYNTVGGFVGAADLVADLKVNAALKASEEVAEEAAGGAALIVAEKARSSIWATISGIFGGGLTKINSFLVPLALDGELWVGNTTTFLSLTLGGRIVVSAAAALTNMTINMLGFNLEQNRANLARLRQLGVIQGDKFVATEEQLKAMNNKDFLILAETLANATAVAAEAARRNEEEMLNRLNEQMSLVDPNWNGPAIQQAGMNALTAGLIAQQAWGGTGSYNTERINKGMREQIRSNMNQSGMGGGGYVFYHLTKNLVRHTYVKRVDDVANVTIHVGHDNDGNANTSSRVTTFGKNAFRNKGNLQTISFYENTGGATSNASSAFLCVIPDSAFVGCTNLRELNLILETKDNGQRALGPENFIFGGDSIFRTVDSTKFHIVIDPSRKDDFLASESWKPLAKYFTYREAVAKNGSTLNNYGAWYAYAYEQNSIKKEHKKDGHLIQHVFANQADNDFLEDHNGALKLTVDIGSYNNYQTDYVRSGAFRGNQNLRYVNFTDLDLGNNNYSDFEIQLKDYCFADCRNLKFFDLLFLKTDGTNKLLPITPQMLKAGKGIFDNTNAKIRMMPQQVKMFMEADSNWVNNADRFMPCIIKPADEGVHDALKDAVYTDMAAVGTDEGTWTDFIDLSYFLDNGHLSQFGRLLANKKDKIRSFADFKHFESIGLDHIGASWFDGFTKLSNITLPNTAKRIEKRAFAGCTVLKHMTLPTQLTEIQAQAFDGCTQLNTIVVPVGKPATLTGAGQFYKHAGLRIFVPDSVVSLYKQQWAEYKDYIIGMKDYKINKVVTVTQTGQLAEKLGLTIIEDATTVYDSQVRWIEGPYAMYDSLTVIGPLNGRDMSVIRYLAGADAWNSDRTDGNLRYLNLWNADLKKDKRWSYNNDNADDFLEKDNQVGDNLFENCEAIETIILPKSATEIGEEVFENTISLKRIAIGRKTTTYDEDLLQDLDELGGIEEVVFLTDQHASSDDDDAWDAPIQRVYVPKSQIGSYMNDNCLTSRAQSISSLFDDEHVMYHVAEKGGLFFPSEIRATESIDGIFTGDTELKDFSEFSKFYGVKHLGSNAFNGCSNLKTITLPGAVEGISTGAFDGCTKLDSIRVNCDSIFTLEPDVFESLPADFRIYVPKMYIAKYQERWSQYKEHIVVDESSYSDDELITVTLTEPNTLHEKLGLQVELSSHNHWLEGVKGDYSRIKKLKVIGPISGTDFELMRYLAGYTLWTKETNYLGQLEYIDLYDAQIRRTDNQGSMETRGGVIRMNAVMTDDVLHEHALKRATKLKTLILPKTCKKIIHQALVDCSNLETIVFGDDLEKIDWTCFDDDAQLTYAYFLSKKKPEIVWEAFFYVDNNYAPTCDAFYVRPSLYRDYLDDTDYTNNSTSPLTNLISRGAFNSDDSFEPFAQHAVASLNDLITVKNVDNWFDSNRDVKDLTALRYTKVKRLRKDDFQKLTQLERIALPISTEKLEEGIFQKSPNLRFVDFLAVEPSVADSLKNGGLKKLGIDLQKTLAYVPMTYGQTEETNVVYGSEGAGLMAHNYRLYDGWDYTVPYAFQTKTVENSRTLAKSDVPYTVCLPYKMDVPYGVKAYQLSDREGSELVFKEISELTLEPMQPYLLKVIDEGIDPEHPGAQLTSTIAQEIPTSGGNTFGRQIDTYGYSMRGTFDAIDNQTAHELNAYVLKSDGRWYLVGNDTEAHRKAYIPAYRCYLLLNGGYKAPSLDMTLEDNPTAIEEPEIETIKTVDRDGTEQIFDLSGRKLVRIPERGIYIMNGKKYIKK